MLIMSLVEPSARRASHKKASLGSEEEASFVSFLKKPVSFHVCH